MTLIVIVMVTFFHSDSNGDSDNKVVVTEKVPVIVTMMVSYSHNDSENDSDSENNSSKDNDDSCH